MKKLIVELNSNLDVEEFYKSVSFISPEINDVVLKNELLELSLSDQADLDSIQKQLYEMEKKYVINNSNNDIYYKNKNKKQQFFDLKMSDENIIFFEDGQIGFGKKGKFLLEFFDSLFCSIAIRMNAIEKVYPVLLPIKEYSQTGYIKKSPQYAIFCSSVNDKIDDLEKAYKSVEDNQIKNVIKEPEYALSPSACFHTYIEYRNKSLPNNTLITFKQNVFRNEGRFNYKEIGRLRDYHVREIVMIGDVDYVEKTREMIMEESCKIMKNLNLSGDITIASDSFIVPKMLLYKKIQKIDKSKYEMHLSLSDSKSISVASFNLHGKAFTDSFKICVDQCEDTVTGCVGFGLQRWVLAFVAQYGWEVDNWPSFVKQKYV